MAYQSHWFPVSPGCAAIAPRRSGSSPASSTPLGTLLGRGPEAAHRPRESVSRRSRPPGKLLERTSWVVMAAAWLVRRGAEATKELQAVEEASYTERGPPSTLRSTPIIHARMASISRPVPPGRSSLLGAWRLALLMAATSRAPDAPAWFIDDDASVSGSRGHDCCQTVGCFGPVVAAARAVVGGEDSP